MTNSQGGDILPQINFTQGIIKYTDIKPIFAGMSQCKNLHCYGPAVRHHCIIHYCVRGKGVFQNKDGVHEICAGQAFIINPEEITFYQADETDPWMYIWIAFSGTVCDSIREISPILDLGNSEVFDEIRTLIANGVCRPEEYLVCLIRLFGQILPSSTDNLPGYALRAKDYIKLHYMEDISVENIAASLNIDRRYLLRLFKKEFGVTVVNFIIRTRLDAAHEFLRSGIPVNKTAVMCGYSDVYNFSKMFKKYHGIPPSEVKAGNPTVLKLTDGEAEDYIYCQ